MSLDDPSDPTSIVALAQSHGHRQGQPSITSFHRRELSLILAIYGRMLSAGIARDYAIDHLRDRAVFSIFRRASETPLYTVEKRPRDANRQGAWSVVSTSGGILKRGRDLAQVLRVLDQKLIRAVDNT
ncbi:MAG: DUF2794 domain-containing protein [Pseudomonadota bacterium]